MKIVHFDIKTRKILGYYSEEVHDTIPKPNFEITDEAWSLAINENHNFIDQNGITKIVEFRTKEEVKSAKEAEINGRAHNEIIEKYPLWKQANINADYTQYPESEIFKKNFEDMRLYINQIRAYADLEVMKL